jgi:hypothetical protein
VGRFGLVWAAAVAMPTLVGMAQTVPGEGDYRVTKTVKVGGPGTFDTVFADTAGRRLYIP